MKRIASFALGIILLLSMSVPAFAAEQPAEIEAAGLYLHEQGIYLGDSSGNLMLDKGLTRAEMAAILTRLHSGEEVNPEQYIRTKWYPATTHHTLALTIWLLRPWHVR